MSFCNLITWAKLISEESKFKFKNRLLKFRIKLFILTSIVDLSQDLRTGFEFRDYQYARTGLSLIEKGPNHSKCLNTKAALIIMNKKFFLTQFKELIRTMITKIIVRDIDSNKHWIKEYVISLIFFRRTDDQSRQIKTCIRRKIYLINDLKINVLIKTNVLIFEKFILNFKKGLTRIKNCSINILIQTKRHVKSVNQLICLKEIIIVFSRFQIQVRIHNLNFFDKDFFFKFENVSFDFYFHVMGLKTSDVLIRNEEDKPLKILRNFRLKRMIEMNYSNAYIATKNTMDLIIEKSQQIHQKAYFQKLLQACLFNCKTDSNSKKSDLKESTIQIKKEIMIHNANLAFIRRMMKLVNNYSVIWFDQGFATLSKSEWMRISLKKNSEIRTSFKTAVYPLDIKDRELIDETFDELHRKGKLQWTT